MLESSTLFCFVIMSVSSDETGTISEALPSSLQFCTHCVTHEQLVNPLVCFLSSQLKEANASLARDNTLTIPPAPGVSAPLLLVGNVSPIAHSPFTGSVARCYSKQNTLQISNFATTSELNTIHK